MKDVTACRGCRNDFYNGHNDLNVKQCWSVKDAQIVTRYRIGKWTQQDRPGAFQKVKVPDCYHRSDEAYYKDLPLCAVEVVRS